MAVDYLVIGHVTQDLRADGTAPGGTAAYASLTAAALGASPGVVTSLGPDAALGPLARIPMHVVPAPASTTFVNETTAGERRQWVRAVAAPLDGSAVPPSFLDAAVVHLGPVAQEVDPAMAELFPSSSFVGVTPQGWMREWGPDGAVHHRAWDPPSRLARRADAAVISVEDVDHDEDRVASFVSAFDLAVVTSGAAGARLFVGGREPTHLSSPPWDEVDATGAGDIFAAVFFLRLAGGAAALDAAREATALAADSVRRVGLAAVPPRQNA